MTSPPKESNRIKYTPSSPQDECYYLSPKKPRNYKYWSDEEIKKILHWLTLPENEGKLARNKAQACREVAKTLFDGDEYMAISVRSKLMSLEKLFKETEHINKNSFKDDALLSQDKLKEISKFYKECKQLFSKNDTFSSNPTLSSPTLSTPTPISPKNQHPSLPRFDYDSLTIKDNSPPLTVKTSSRHHESPSLPRLIDLAPLVPAKRKRHDKIDIKLAKYASKQASYQAKIAEFEALKSESDLKVAEIQLSRDKIHLKKLELELELFKAKR